LLLVREAKRKSTVARRGACSPLSPPTPANGGPLPGPSRRNSRALGSWTVPSSCVRTDAPVSARRGRRPPLPVPDAATPLGCEATPSRDRFCFPVHPRFTIALATMRSRRLRRTRRSVCYERTRQLSGAAGDPFGVAIVPIPGVALTCAKFSAGEARRDPRIRATWPRSSSQSGPEGCR
jgi:hypothetical protein